MDSDKARDWLERIRKGNLRQNDGIFFDRHEPDRKRGQHAADCICEDCRALRGDIGFVEQPPVDES